MASGFTYAPSSRALRDDGQPEQSIFDPNSSSVTAGAVLTIEETVSAGDGAQVTEKDKAVSFPFRLRLDGEDGPISGQYHYAIFDSETGTLIQNPDYIYMNGDSDDAKYLFPLELKNGAATIILNAFQEAFILGIDTSATYQYTISPRTLSGYTRNITESAAEGTLAANGEAVHVAFDYVKQAARAVTVSAVDVKNSLSAPNGGVPGDGIYCKFIMQAAAGNPGSDPLAGKRTAAASLYDSGEVSVSPALFPEATFTTPGTYEYSIREDFISYLSDVMYDDTIYDVVVDVAEDYGENNIYKAALKATVTITDTNGKLYDAIVFRNTYDSAKTSITLTGTKAVFGKTLRNGDFTFKLTPVYGATYPDPDPAQLDRFIFAPDNGYTDWYDGDDPPAVESTAAPEATQEPTAEPDSTAEPDATPTPGTEQEGETTPTPPTETPDIGGQTPTEPTPGETVEPTPTSEPTPDVTPEEPTPTIPVETAAPTAEPSVPDTPEKPLEPALPPVTDENTEQGSEGDANAASVALLFHSGYRKPLVKLNRAAYRQGMMRLPWIWGADAGDMLATLAPVEPTEESAEETPAPQDQTPAAASETPVAGDETAPTAAPEIPSNILAAYQVPMPGNASVDEDGVPAAYAKNSAAGDFIFGHIEYNGCGTYVYEVTEVDDGQEDVLHDPAVFYVEIGVTKSLLDGSYIKTITYLHELGGTPLYFESISFSSSGVQTTETVPGEGGKVVEGSEISYDISYGNSSGADAAVTVTDVLDPGLELVDAGSGVYDESTHTVTWDVGAVAPRTSGKVSLTVRATADAASAWGYDERECYEGYDNRVVNRASVTMGDVTMTAQEVKNFMPKDDAAPQIEEVSPGEGEKVDYGDEITYKIDWFNYKSADASVTVTDELDEGFDFVSASTDGVYDERTRTVTWKLDGCPATSGGEVELCVRVNEDSAHTGKVRNQAYVQVDTDTAQGTEIPENPVNIPIVEKDPQKEEMTPGEEQPVSGGDTITYRITWQNYKSEPATVTVRDVLDTNVEFVTASGSYTRNSSDGSVEWTIPNAMPGEEGYVTITVRVLETAPTPGTVGSGAFIQVDDDTEKQTDIPLNPVQTSEKELLRRELRRRLVAYCVLAAIFMAGTVTSVRGILTCRRRHRGHQ